MLLARENLTFLAAEQKKIQKQKVGLVLVSSLDSITKLLSILLLACCHQNLLEHQFVELRDQARRLEELLPRRVSSEEQREVLGLLCKVHELEIENAEMQSHALLKDNVIRQKNFVVQRFEQYSHLCDEIIQQQRQFIDGEFNVRGEMGTWDLSMSDFRLPSSRPQSASASISPGAL